MHFTFLPLVPDELLRHLVVPNGIWFDNLALTDVQDGGISFITSGDYARASVIDGDWAVMRSIPMGHTQAQATKKGDTTVNPLPAIRPLHESRRQVAQLNGTPPIQSYVQSSSLTSSTASGCSASMTARPMRNSNIYLDISASRLAISACMQPGFRKETLTPTILPDPPPAIRPTPPTTQPNGFSSAFLPLQQPVLDDVDIRHYVIDAPFVPGTIRRTRA